MYRTFEKKLEKWDANKTKPLIVLGVRQCGKTYILKQFFNKKYKKFTYINLFNDDRIIEICKIDFDNYKLFFSDVGLLRKTVNANSYDVLVSKDYTSKGIITENYVACELQKQFNELNYWTRKNDGNGSKAEVDFVIQIKNEIIPIEVKSGNNKSQSLRIYNEKFKPNLMIKITNANFGKNNNIKTIPLYATFLIRDCLEEIYK